MKRKAAIKWTLDVLMTVALLFLMGYQFWGETVHEWIGAGMFIFFIAHQILNGKWYRNLLRGKYTAFRILQTIINILTLASMLALMYSGIVLSRHVFSFLPFRGGLALARRLHILGSYWGFLLMSLHLGLHWSMVLGRLRIKMRSAKTMKVRSGISLAAGILIAGYGISVLIRRDFLTYLLLRSEFVFLDYNEPIVLFYLDYLALMGTCIFLVHYLSRLCRRISSRRGDAE